MSDAWVRHECYEYDGPVMIFDKVHSNRWQGITYAPSKRKATSNLKYQYKKQYGFTPSTRVSLVNEVVKSK